MQTRAIGDNTIAGADFNMDRLLSLLKQNLAREMTAYYLYNILTIYLDELELHGIREIIDSACARDRRHYKSLLKRFHQLSGTFPAGIKGFDVNLNDRDPTLSAVHLNLKEAFEKMVEVKRSSVLGYTRLCNLTLGRDRRTYLMALSILNEELELKTWFSQFMDAKYPEIDLNNPL